LKIIENQQFWKFLVKKMSINEVSSMEACVPAGDDHMPSPEELESYYVMLEADNIPELLWQSPGRISESPENSNHSKEQESVSNNMDLQE